MGGGKVLSMIMLATDTAKAKRGSCPGLSVFLQLLEQAGDTHWDLHGAASEALRSPSRSSVSLPWHRFPFEGIDAHGKKEIQCNGSHGGVVTTRRGRNHTGRVVTATQSNGSHTRRSHK